jgi:hypothetical protein
VAKADACLIDGACKKLGDLKEKDLCLACGQAQPNDWSPREVGSTCKLQDSCFTSFACTAEGACQGTVAKTPAAPRPIRPISGTRTGSVWAPAARATLRPKFVWSDVNDTCAAVNYQLQLVGGCTTSTACDFSDPEIDVADLQAATYQPDADLGASVVAPVGRRYHWRVRACRGVSCSAWSATRYVDVGRAPHDYDGDGYTDLAIAAYSHYKVAVAYGSPSGPGTPVQVAQDRRVNYGTTGDVNGDGFSDLLLFSWQDNLTPPGRYYGYYGSALGLPAQPQWETIRIVDGYPQLSFSADFSNDGYDDLVVQSYEPFPPSADYFAGSASGPPNTRTTYLTGQTPPADRVERMTTGDVNADALPDLIAAAGWFARIHVWNSNGSGLPMAASDIVPTLISGSDHPAPIAVGDADGDYQDDLFHALTRSVGYSYGVLYHFRAQGGGYPDQPTQVFPDSTHATTDSYGTDIVGGQLVGQDGLWDFAINAPGTLAGGTIYVYESSKLQSLQPILLNNPNADGGWGYSSPLQVPGDLNGDGNDDLIVCDSHYQDNGGAVIYYGPITAQSTVGGYVERPADFATFCDILL